MINLITDLISFTQPTNLDRESLSVIESIAKIKTKINECINEFNNLEKIFEDLTKDNNSFKNEFREIIKSLENFNVTLEIINKQSEYIQELAKINQTNIDKGTIVTKDEINKINMSLKEKAKQSYVDSKVNEINSSIEEIATKGTTVEVIERATKEEINRQIDDGTIGNLTIENNSITKEKYQDESITASKTMFIKSFFNFIDKTSIDINKYWYLNNGELIKGVGTNTGTFEPIELKGGCTYYFNKGINNFTFLKEKSSGTITKLNDYKGLSSFDRGIKTIKKIDIENDSFLYITTATNLDYSDIMLVENSMPYTYKNYNDVFNYEINNIPTTGVYNEIITVGTDKDFASLNDVVSRLDVNYPGDKYHTITILLDDGNYTLNSEFSMPEFVNIESRSNNPHKCTVTYAPTSPSDFDVTTYSALKMVYGNNKLKGIKFIGKNCRYVVHPESAGNCPDYTNEIDNCIFEHLENEVGSWTSQFAWGEGTSSGCRLIANNCTFIAHANNSVAFSVHNNVNFSNPILYTMNNCHFYSYKYSSCLRCEGMASNTDDRLYLNNCELNGNVMLTNSRTITVYAMGTTHVCSSSTDYFAENSQVLYDEYTAHIKNTSGETLPPGTIVCYDNSYKKVRKMLETDDAKIVAGFTIGETAPGELALVVKDGWYRFLDDNTFGKEYGVANGALSATATNKIGAISGEGFVRIKSYF